MSPFEKLCGKIHAIYRPYQSTPLIERYDIELCTFETMSSSQDFHYCTVMTRVLLLLATVCMFLVDLIIKLLASLTLQKEKGKEIASMKNRKSSTFGVATQGKILFVMP